MFRGTYQQIINYTWQQKDIFIIVYRYHFFSLPWATPYSSCQDEIWIPWMSGLKETNRDLQISQFNKLLFCSLIFLYYSERHFENGSTKCPSISTFTVHMGKIRRRHNVVLVVHNILSAATIGILPHQYWLGPLPQLINAISPQFIQLLISIIYKIINNNRSHNLFFGRGKKSKILHVFSQEC